MDKQTTYFIVLCNIVLGICIFAALAPRHECSSTHTSHDQVKEPDPVETKEETFISLSGKMYTYEYQVKHLRVTAYCPCKKCCGDHADGITANGYVLQSGDKAIAAPPEYAFGTVMYVPGYGVARVLDRGGAIKGDRIDVFFSSHQAALNWGVQMLEVEIHDSK